MWPRHACLPRRDFRGADPCRASRRSFCENLQASAALSSMRDFHRRLPHQHPEGKWFFVTWHLHGSLPHAVYPPREKLTSGTAFVRWIAIWTPRALDLYLAQHSLAGIVVASLHRGALLGHYELGAYVVMSNHVHVLVLPKISPSKLMQSLKGATAREANQANLVLGRTGETFWQAESYDHWVRDERNVSELR